MTTLSADKPATSKKDTTKKASKTSMTSKHDYKTGDFVVYPAHGVGQIVGIETQSVAGIDIELYVIAFEQEKMTLRVPTSKAKAAGMRGLASTDVISSALKTLKGRARIKRVMWSRRAQEYEAKINSGNLVQVAEVVRDLHRNADQPEQSYSERQLYETALDRMARELAAAENTDRDAAVAKLSKTLTKVAS